VWLPLDSLYFSPDFGEENLLFLGQFGFMFYVFFLVLIVLALVQLERTLAGLSQYERWRVKLEIVGVGLLLTAAVVFYSQAILYRSLDIGLLPIRSIALILALGLIFYSRIFRSKGGRVRVSQDVAYRSIVLFAVGCYLVGLGLLGEGMRYLDIPAQRTLFILVGLISGIAVVILLLSEKIRRKIKVSLHKNFYQSKHEYRQQWQAFTDRLSTAESYSQLQTVVLIHFCETFGCQGGALYLKDPDKKAYIQAAHFEFRRDWREFLMDDSLVEQLAQKDWIIDLHTAESVYLEESLIDSFQEVGAHFVIPLFFNGELLGFVILSGLINPAEKLSYEDFDLMRMLARQSISSIQSLRLAEQLTTARELAAMGKVSTFVLHDLKNQVSGLSLMLDNAREYIEDPEFQKDMLETVGNTVNNMKNLIARLKNLKEKPQLSIAPVALKKIILEAIETSGALVELAGDSVEIAADEEEIYKVMLNLLVNAVEASSAGQPVKVVFGIEDNSVYIRVSDSGCGMSPDFIENQLFKPFQTTKRHGFGVGLYQCRHIVEAHDGQILVASRKEEGTTFTVLLPIASEMISSPST
ncbi:MAG: PEP-CTERM system histidine kinase PrsK, partial [Desulfuromonadales bacterium]|nr:PEP-CTERM system histidine kinase PrsK [Desulfuromonadales bacterium]